MTNRATRSSMQSPRSDNGAVLIQTAIVIFMLTSLTAFVLDAGVLWVSRRAAQNAADAAALAAGTGMLYDSYGDRTNGGPAHTSGVNVATANSVFGGTPGVIVEQSLNAAGWTPDSPQTCKDAPGTCAQASVFRDGTNGSGTLPTFFAGLVGQSSQKTRATATVQLRGGNGTKCLKPWYAPDKSDVSTYDFTDIGTVLLLRYQAGPSAYNQIDVRQSGGVCAGGGANCYRDAIRHCSNRTDGRPWQVGDIADEKPGNTVGGQVQNEIYLQDPGASWNAATKSVQGSCAATNSCACATNHTCANGLDGAISPRILTVALFKPAALVLVSQPGNGSAPIAGFAGIFMLQPGTGPLPECTASQNNVCGYLMPVPGSLNSGPAPSPGGTLNVVLSLIR